MAPKFTADEMEEITEVVTVFDKVGDGKLDVDDIVNALRSLGCNPPSNAWKDEIAGYKEEGMQRIDLDEFSCIYKAELAKTPPTYKELCDGLKAVDPLHGEEGKVNLAILKRFMTVVGDTVSDEDADTVMASCLVKGGQYVNIEQLIKKVRDPQIA